MRYPIVWQVKDLAATGFASVKLAADGALSLAALVDGQIHAHGPNLYNRGESLARNRYA